MILEHVAFGAVLLGFIFSEHVSATMSYIKNDQVTLGVDTSEGCSITYFAATHNGENVINTHDHGREVQASFYSGPSNYENCQFEGHDWPWNPIGSGDIVGHSSPVLAAHNDGTTITCTVRPLQWACNNVPCECLFELTYSLDANSVRGNVTLINQRSDHTVYPARGQELPAVYVNGFLYKLTGYTDSAPWTNGPLQEWDAGFVPSKGQWIPGMTHVTEPWLAFVSDSGFAVGVYSNFPNLDGILAGFAGSPKGSGGSSDDQTGYMAPVATLPIAWNERLSYEFWLVMGNLPNVRSTIYRLHQQHG